MVLLELKGCGVLSEASINCPLLTSLDASFCRLCSLLFYTSLTLTLTPRLSLETKLNPLFVLYYAASLGMIACLQQLLHAR